MMKQFDVVIEKDSESYFVASVPALRGCHTQAKSLYVLIERIRESIELCLEVQGEIPEPLDFVGIQRISVAEFAARDIVTLESLPLILFAKHEILSKTMEGR